MIYDIIALRQYEDKIDLYCNCYFRGYRTIEYFTVSNPDHKIRKDLNAATITISNLFKDEYIFKCYSSKGVSDPLIVNIFFETKGEYFNKILDNIDKKDQDILNNLKTDDWLPELYQNYLNDNRSEYKESYLKIIDALISNMNNMITYMNSDDGFNIKLDNSHIVSIDLSDPNYFNSYNTTIKIKKFTQESEYYEAEKTYGFIEDMPIAITGQINNILLDEGLYSISIEYNNSLIRSFWIRVEDEEKRLEIFNQKLEDIQTIKNAKMDTSYFLSSEYQFKSEEEKEVITNMEYGTGKTYLFTRPNLEYRNNILSYSCNNEINFFKVANKKFYLCGYEADTLYLDNAVPHRLLIEREENDYDIRLNFFNRERYYFNIQDEDGNVLSAITTIDLSNENESDESVDYNDRYERIQWNKYVKNLYRLLGNDEYWGEVKTNLDRYLISGDVGFNDVKLYLEQQLLATLSYNYNNLENLIFNIEFCDSRYRLPSNKSFMNKQTYKRLYRSHVIPAGKYILQITRINGDRINNEYKYYSGEAVETKVSDDDIIILKCIDPDTIKVSDFVMYNNTGYGVPYRYNSVEVEILNVL